MAHDIILTGIPRSGTTLAAQLIDLQVDSVCLNEPEWHRPHPSLREQAELRLRALEREHSAPTGAQSR